MVKTALLNVADTQPAMDLAYMLGHMGYECHQPCASWLSLYRDIGMVGVQSNIDLVKDWGYDRLTLPVYDGQMENVSLFVDTKGFRNCSTIVRRWPELRGRVLCYHINGGPPRNTEDNGNGVYPSCPVVTPNRWYNLRDESITDIGTIAFRECWRESHISYVFWPALTEFDNMYNQLGRLALGNKIMPYPPICLCHNINGWGHAPLVQGVRELGVKLHGVNSPDGLISHTTAKERLRFTLAYVHLKGGDAMGYALMEAMAAACPVIVSRKYIADVKCGDLLVEGETCLCFDDADRGGPERRGLHADFTHDEIIRCIEEIRISLDILRDPFQNKRIGNNGRTKLDSLRWRADRDGASFKEFMQRNFP